LSKTEDSRTIDQCICAGSTIDAFFFYLQHFSKLFLRAPKSQTPSARANMQAHPQVTSKKEVRVILWDKRKGNWQSRCETLRKEQLERK